MQNADAQPAKRAKPSFALPDVFSDCAIMLLGSTLDNRLERYLVAYAAQIATKFSTSVTHVITDADWNTVRVAFVRWLC